MRGQDWTNQRGVEPGAKLSRPNAGGDHATDRKSKRTIDGSLADFCNTIGGTLIGGAAMFRLRPRAHGPGGGGSGRGGRGGGGLGLGG